MINGDFSMDYEPNYRFTALLIIALMIMAIFMQPQLL